MHKSFFAAFAYVILMVVIGSCSTLSKEYLEIVGYIEKGQIRSDIARPNPGNLWGPRPPKPIPPCIPKDFINGNCTRTDLFENIVIANNDQLFTLTIQDANGNEILKEKMDNFKKTTSKYRVYSVKKKIGSVSNATIALTVTNKDGSNSRTISKSGVSIVER